MSNELVRKESTDLASAAPHSIFSAENFSHYAMVAEKLSKTQMVPKNYIGKPMDIMVAIEMGMALGLSMLQSLQDIAVINGKPTMYGDGMLAVVQGHPAYEWIKEEFMVDNGKIIGAQCTVKRRNHEPHTVQFTIEDAKTAKLWMRKGASGHDTPWVTNPNRMLQMRARGFALRDMFSDALRGIKSVEEVQDYIDVTPSSRPSAKESLQNLVKQSQPKMIITEPEQVEDSPTRIKLIEEVEELLIATDFPAERLIKALEHYKCSDLENLTKEQLTDFISILKKELTRLAEIENELNVDPETGEVIQ